VQSVQACREADKRGTMSKESGKQEDHFAGISKNRPE